MPTPERDSFNAIAAAYDAVRPSYPDALFADLAAVVGGPGARVLEVGCGSGQATAGFLSRGWDVLAVDPGAELVALAASKFDGAAPEGVGQVRFAVSRFEDFAPEAGAFRLVASAQAWHWVEPFAGFARVRAALQPGGVFAVFGHVPGLSAEVRARLAPVYAELAPEFLGPPPEAWYLPAGPVPGLFAATGMFGPVTHRGYSGSVLGDADDFVRQLATRSYCNTLEALRRERLLEAVRAALAPLGRFAFETETHLYWAALTS